MLLLLPGNVMKTKTGYIMLQSIFVLIESVNSSFSISKHFGKLVGLLSSNGTISKKGENTDKRLDKGPSKL